MNHIVDIVCAGALIIYLLLGLRRGLLGELVRLVVVLISLGIAYLLLPYISNIVSEIGFEHDVHVEKGFLVIIFMLASSICQLFIVFPVSGRRALPIGFFSRIVGGITGVVIGAVYAGSILVAISSFMADGNSIKKAVDSGVISGSLQDTFNFAYGNANKVFRKEQVDEVKKVLRKGKSKL
ncbi:hypothetical protein RsTz2092_00220 [Deferribacterales bacterium RsTz2092]|nr:hypothetical protein AGMMS49941_00290 [Deferribacterales bacterium]